MKSLLSALGAVCESCERYNDPGVAACGACGAPLQGAIWLGASDLAAPGTPPAPSPVAPAPDAAAARESAALLHHPEVAPAAPRTPGPPAAAVRPLPRDAAWASAFESPAPALAAWARASDSRAAQPDDAVQDAAGCPRCGRANPLGTAFCPGCGMRQAEAPARRPIGVQPGRFSPGSARLVLLRGLEASGTIYPLREERTQAGRSSGGMRFPADDTLAPLAATFTYHADRLFVRDEGGPSGIFVRIFSPAFLAAGDTFSIGDKLVRFLEVVPPPDQSGAHPRLGSMWPGAGPLLRVQMIHLGGIPGRTFARPAPLRIGRALGEILITDDPFVSARHCELDLDRSGAVLRDLGSSNGTFRRLPIGGEQELAPGDTLRLGRNILRVE